MACGEYTIKTYIQPIYNKNTIDPENAATQIYSNTFNCNLLVWCSSLIMRSYIFCVYFALNNFEFESRIAVLKSGNCLWHRNEVNKNQVSRVSRRPAIISIGILGRYRSD